MYACMKERERERRKPQTMQGDTKYHVSSIENIIRIQERPWLQTAEMTGCGSVGT